MEIRPSMSAWMVVLKEHYRPERKIYIPVYIQWWCHATDSIPSDQGTRFNAKGVQLWVAFPHTLSHGKPSTNWKMEWLNEDSYGASEGSIFLKSGIWQASYRRKYMLHIKRLLSLYQKYMSLRIKGWKWKWILPSCYLIIHS